MAISISRVGYYGFCVCASLAVAAGALLPVSAATANALSVRGGSYCTTGGCHDKQTTCSGSTSCSNENGHRLFQWGPTTSMARPAGAIQACATRWAAAARTSPAAAGERRMRLIAPKRLQPPIVIADMNSGVHMSWIRATPGLLFVLCFGFSTAVGEGADDNGPALLKAAIAAHAWESRYQSVTTVQYRAKVKEASRQYVVGADSTVSKFQDGDRLRILAELTDHLSPSGTLIKSASRHVTVFAQNVRTSWWSPLEQPLRGTLQLAKDAERVARFRMVARCDCMTGSFLDGYVDGLGNLAELMLQSPASLIVQDEKVGGIDCKRVESRSANGLMEVWIAPSKGDCVVKFLLQKDDPATGPTRAEFEATSFAEVGNMIAVAAGRSTRNWLDSQSMPTGARRSTRIEPR